MRILMVFDSGLERMNKFPASIELFRLQLLRSGHAVTLLAPEGAIDKPAPDVLCIPPRFMLMDPQDSSLEAAPARSLVARLRAEGHQIVQIYAPFPGRGFGMRLAQALDLPAIETWLTPLAYPFEVAPPKSTRAVNPWLSPFSSA